MKKVLLLLFIIFLFLYSCNSPENLVNLKIKKNIKNMGDNENNFSLQFIFKNLSKTKNVIFLKYINCFKDIVFSDLKNVKLNVMPNTMLEFNPFPIESNFIELKPLEEYKFDLNFSLKIIDKEYSLYFDRVNAPLNETFYLFYVKLLTPNVLIDVIKLFPEQLKKIAQDKYPNAIIINEIRLKKKLQINF